MAYAGSFFVICRTPKAAMVAVEEKVVDLCVNGRAGVFQIIRKKIVSGNVQSVGDRNEEFEAQSYLARLNSAYMLIIDKD